MQITAAKSFINCVLGWLIVVVWLYVAVRALMVDMTHDEAYSFYNVKHFWWVETLCTGNTHWLNFVAIKSAVLAGFEQIIALRWFSLLSCGVFFYVVFLWIKTLNSVWIKLLAFCLICFHPYLLDYFGLARGYASALMFEGLCLCFFLKGIHSQKQWHYFFALCFGALSAVANFNFFYFFSAFCLYYFYSCYFKQGLMFLKKPCFYADAIIAVATALLVIKALAFITKCSNDIGAYGGEVMIPSVFSGYMDGLLHPVYKPLHSSLFNSFTYIFFGFIAITVLYGLIRIKHHNNKLYVLSSVIICIILLLTMINKWCFGVLYPTYRTTLMLFPLFAINTVVFFGAMAHDYKPLKALVILLCILLIVNFSLKMNVSSTFDYSEQQDAKEAFAKLETLDAKRVGIAPELYGVFRNYYQVTDHYRYSFAGESINTAIPAGTDNQTDQLAQYDYLVLFPPYNLSFYKGNRVAFSFVDYYGTTGTLLVKVVR